MLVIRRKVGESFFIDDDIEVIVLGNIRGQIKIGITAPPDVNIAREELVIKQKEKK